MSHIEAIAIAILTIPLVWSALWVLAPPINDEDLANVQSNYIAIAAIVAAIIVVLVLL